MGWWESVRDALEAQLFEEISLAELQPPGTILLPPVGASDAIIQAISPVNDDQRWLRIGQQLALLKSSPATPHVFVGPTGPLGALHMLFTEEWNGDVTPDFFEQRYEWIWGIARGVAELAPAFKLPDEAAIREVVRTASAQAPSSVQPWLPTLGAIANLLLQISESSGAFEATFLLVDTTQGGAKPDTVQWREQDNTVKQVQGLHSRRLFGVLVDLAGRMAHGRATYGLDLDVFNGSLRGAVWT